MFSNAFNFLLSFLVLVPSLDAAEADLKCLTHVLRHANQRLEREKLTPNSLLKFGRLGEETNWRQSVQVSIGSDYLLAAATGNQWWFSDGRSNRLIKEEETSPISTLVTLPGGNRGLREVAIALNQQLVFYQNTSDVAEVTRSWALEAPLRFLSVGSIKASQGNRGAVRRLLVGASDNNLYLWNLGSTQEKPLEKISISFDFENISALAVLEDSAFVALGRKIFHIDLTTKEKTQIVWFQGDNKVSQIAVKFDPRLGKTVLVVSRGSQLEAFEFEKNSPTRSLGVAEANPVELFRSIAFKEDGGIVGVTLSNYLVDFGIKPSTDVLVRRQYEETEPKQPLIPIQPVTH